MYVKQSRTYLIKSSRFCSFSVMIFDGLAAISHSNFGKHASRILLANASLSFKSICSNLAFAFDFFEMKSSMSLDVGEPKINLQTERKRKSINALSGKVFACFVQILLSKCSLYSKVHRTCSRNDFIFALLMST